MSNYNSGVPLKCVTEVWNELPLFDGSSLNQRASFKDRAQTSSLVLKEATRQDLPS